MSSKEIAGLWKKLQEDINSGNDNAITMTVESLLNSGDKSPELYAIKVVALCKLERFSDVTEFVKKIPKEINNYRVNYSRAYAIYKLGQYPQCIQFINDLPSDQRMESGSLKKELILLSGQAHAKLGEYIQAFHLFSQSFHLLKTKNDQDQIFQEVTVNLSNCLYHLLNLSENGCINTSDIQDKIEKSLLELLEYSSKNANKNILRETLINLSSLFSLRGVSNETLRQQAYLTLKLANDQVKQDEAESMADEKQIELDKLVLSLQEDYLTYQIDKLTPSTNTIEVKIKRYEKYLYENEKYKLDEFTRLCLLNTCIFFKGCLHADTQNEGSHSSHIFNEDVKVCAEITGELCKKNNLKQVNNVEDFKHLNHSHQMLIINIFINKVILLLLRNKFTEGLALLESFPKIFPTEILNSSFGYSLYLKIYCYYKQKQFQQIENLTKNPIDKRYGLLAAIIQLYVYQISNNSEKFIQSTRSLILNYLDKDLKELNNLDKCYSEVILILVKIVLKLIIRNETLTKEFKSFISASLDHISDIDSLMQIGEIFQSNKTFELAIAAFEKIQKLDPKNTMVPRKLAVVKGLLDPTKIESFHEFFPNYNQVIVRDPQELRALEMNYLSKLPAKKEVAVPEIINEKVSDPELLAKRKKKKKSKKIRYPKDFDPENPGPKPDPERWLPRMERSKFKKIAKNKGLSRGAQGSVTGRDTNITLQTGPTTANKETIASTTANANRKKKTNKKKKK